MEVLQWRSNAVEHAYRRALQLREVLRPLRAREVISAAEVAIMAVCCARLRACSTRTRCCVRVAISRLHFASSFASSCHNSEVRILISAGEASGEYYGAELIH